MHDFAARWLSRAWFFIAVLLLRKWANCFNKGSELATIEGYLKMHIGRYLTLAQECFNILCDLLGLSHNLPHVLRMSLTHTLHLIESYFRWISHPWCLALYGRNPVPLATVHSKHPILTSLWPSIVPYTFKLISICNTAPCVCVCFRLPGVWWGENKIEVTNRRLSIYWRSRQGQRLIQRHRVAYFEYQDNLPFFVDSPNLLQIYLGKIYISSVWWRNFPQERIKSPQSH